MDSLTGRDLVALFAAIAAMIEAHKETLSQLDGVIGDADHGVTMAIGFSAVRAALNDLAAARGADDEVAPALVFETAARSFLDAVGASSGPLYASGFLRAAAAARGRERLDAAATAEVYRAMAAGIQARGKAARGDKTMLDAWLPAAEAMADAADRGMTLAACLMRAAEAAREGAEATRAMRALKGRAARLGERSIGHMDPGAASSALILKTIAERVGGLAG